MQSTDNNDDSNHHHQQQNQNHQQQQQQWMQHQYQQQHQYQMMMYPAAAMAMQIQQQQQMMMMMYSQPQNYFHQQHQLQNHHQQQSNHEIQQQQQEQSEDAKTVWIGDLQNWMDETYLHSCFSQTGEVSTVKVIRNKHTGQSEGYGFIEFISHSAAEKVLQTYNNTTMPNADRPFRLNWANVSPSDRRSDLGSDLSIFVGDLAPDVTDRLLQETFSARYPSVQGAKVLSDVNTGRSKGYGFVRFGDESEKSRALSEMNGELCSTRPMRVGEATPKKATGNGIQQYSSQAVVLSGGYASNGAVPPSSQTQTDSNTTNTTLFVGGLHSDVTEEDLRLSFSQYGEVNSIKIPIGKGCGFVQFATRNNAEDAMEGLNGTIIGNQTVRLSWGRNQGNKQWRTNGATYGGQAYNGNGYAIPQSQDNAASAEYGAS